MDTQHYAGLVYHPSHPTQPGHTPAASLPSSSQDMAWHTNSASPPSSSSSSGNSPPVYPLMTRSPEHLEYPQPASFLSRNTPPAYHSPALHHVPSAQSMSFESPQIESSIGPNRIARRRPHSLSLSSSGCELPGGPYHKNHSSISIAGQHTSRSHTPNGFAHPDQSFGHHDSTNPMLTNSHYTMTPASAPPFSQYTFIPSHSRSTSGSISNPRSASPALSVASVMTSVSSSTSGPNSHPQSHSHDMNTYPMPVFRPPGRIKHTKQRLFTTDRRKICEFHQQHPNLKQDEIAKHFGVERSTISKILKHKQRWLQVLPDETTQVARIRPSKFPAIENQLESWLADCKQKNVVLTDSLIRNKAREIGLELGFDEKRFKASSGWVENFKHRVGIRRGVWHGDGRKAKVIRAAVIGFTQAPLQNHRLPSLAYTHSTLYPNSCPQREETQSVPARQADHEGEYDFESDESETPADCTEVYQQSAPQSEWQDHHASATSVPAYHSLLRDDVVHEHGHTHGHMQHPSDVSLDDGPLPIPGDHVPMLSQSGGADHPEDEPIMYVPPMLPEMYPAMEDIRDLREAEDILDRLLRWLHSPVNLELTSHPDRDAVHRIRTAIAQRIQQGIPPSS